MVDYREEEMNESDRMLSSLGPEPMLVGHAARFWFWSGQLDFMGRLSLENVFDGSKGVNADISLCRFHSGEVEEEQLSAITWWRKERRRKHGEPEKESFNKEAVC